MTIAYKSFAEANTPTNASNKLKIEVVFFFSAGGLYTTAALFQDTTAGALAAGAVQSNALPTNQITFTHYMTSGTTSATTFKIRAGCTSATALTFNGLSAGRIFGGVMASSITITEIKV